MQGTSQLGTEWMSRAAKRRTRHRAVPAPPAPPAGIAIDPQGMVYVTATRGASGTLDNVDLTSGALQVGPPLTGAPFSTQINSMSFSPSGLLLAVNSNGGSPANYARLRDDQYRNRGGGHDRRRFPTIRDAALRSSSATAGPQLRSDASWP